jgi:hypothetical protein
MELFGPRDGEVDEESLPGFGRVNYNSMVDATPLGSNSGPVWTIDAGLLKIGPELNACFNWWNDPTGPSGEGPGNGEPLISIGGPTHFVPWLYVVHTDVLDSQLGKFGFYVKMCKGLNTLSTPVALQENMSRTWGDIVANSGLAGQVKYVDRWDDASQTWIPVAPTDTLDPLDAWYIYFFGDCNSVILMVNADIGHEHSMPTRELSGRWNLIGPNPLWPVEWDIAVDEALSSIEQTPGGLPGYTQVISPIVSCQEPWFYVPGMDSREMRMGKGYWVWMENPDILVGFGFTPLPHLVP